MTPKDLIAFAKKNNVKIVDFRFVDIPGVWQHYSIPISHFTEDVFEEGMGFDGSSIRGFQGIQESDMLLFPDPSYSFLDAFTQEPTLNIVCNVVDPITGERYHKDPRYVAQKAENYLKTTGLGDTIYFGPEAEFFVFDDVRYDQAHNKGFYYIDSSEGFWNSGKDEKPNLGHKPRYKEGYFPVPPTDSFQDMRTEMTLEMQNVGIDVELHHHEVGTGGQAEIDIRFGTLTKIADQLMTFKYIVKNVAKRNNKTATFMPKPIFMDNGSGMHCHQSIWKDGKNTFYGEGNYAGLSDHARWYIGGLLKHAPALCALNNPTTNSYRRLVPGYEAPIFMVYSQRNRSAAIRIPMYSHSEKAKRVEFRTPDPSCNAYLAFSAMLMAGLDGIQNKIEPPEPIDKNIYDLPPEEVLEIKGVPASLEEALEALEKDYEFLLKGEVFTKKLIDSYIYYKRNSELKQIQLRPHPYEFSLYYDI
ncbi:MAG: type I glutamate--ammonia ligase [Deltaproteobacteria bacterium]|nr:type I glutamate--ammonia ligase [Deltaproteobacteria bacterium]